MKKLMFSCVAMIASVIVAQEKTIVYGRTGTESTNAKTVFSWFADEAGTTASSVTPWSANSNDYKFVIAQIPKKITQETIFPDCEYHFGSDGTQAYNLNVNMNCGPKIEFPYAYVYGGTTFMGNSDAYTVMQHYGTYHFKKIGTNGTITFTANGIGSSFAKPSFGRTYPQFRGSGLFGKYISDSDVTLKFTASNTTDVEYDTWGQFELAGDFTLFKGNVVVSDMTTKGGFNQHVRVYPGATALGDGSAPNAGALKFGRRSKIYFSEDLIPVQGREITLTMNTDTADNDWVGFVVEEGDRRVFSTPVHGSHGRIEKSGAGTLAVGSSFEVKNLVVTEGTLEILPTATFADDTTITIKRGAAVLSERGKDIPNVTFALEDGAYFSTSDFTIPFDGNVAEMKDCTWVTSVMYADMTKPIPVKLGDYVSMPQNETNRFAVAKFDAALGVKADDFIDIGPKHFGYLPTSWFEVETENGVSTVYLVTKPMIVRIGPANEICRPLDTQYGNISVDGKATQTENFVWSDHLGAHPGADYVHTNGAQLGSWTGWDNNTRTFPGDSLYLSKNTILMKSMRMVFNKLVIGSGSGGFSCIAGSPKIHAFAGNIELQNDILLAGTMEGTTDFHTYALEANLSGSRKLTLSAVTNNFTAQLTGNNENFKGDIEFTSIKKPYSLEAGVSTFEIGSAASLGGELDAFKYDALTISYCSMLRPLESMVLDEMTRGIYLGTANNGGGFDVPEGITLEIKQPIRMGNNYNAACTLYKTGKGVLKLSGDMTFGKDGTNLVDGVNNVFEVREGLVSAADEPGKGCEQLNVKFSDKSGIYAEAVSGGDDSLRYGVKAKSVTAEGDIMVCAVVPEDEPSSFDVAVCTVPAANADLSDAIVPVKLEGYQARKVVKETLTGEDAGLVRYSLHFTHPGFTIIVR